MQKSKSQKTNFKPSWCALHALTIYLNLKGDSMLKQVIGPSPALFVIKKVGSSLFLRGGSDIPIKNLGITEPKPPRMGSRQLTERLRNKAKNQLTRNEALIRSIIERAELSRVVSETDFQNLEEMYAFMHKYKRYLRVKRLLPLGVVGSLTATELTKMTYAGALGSPSVAITIPGIIGYSLPAFYFFHMSYYYAPNKLKPLCQAGKYTLGLAFMLTTYLVDEIAEDAERKFLGQKVPIDINKTGGTIPKDIGTPEDLRRLIEDLKKTSKEFSGKSY